MSSVHEPSYSIIETEVDILEDGHFVMVFPPQEAGKKVTIYNLDHIGRNSRIYTTNILEVGPNAPNVYEISNIDKSLKGFVPSRTNKVYEVILEIGTMCTLAIQMRKVISLSNLLTSYMPDRKSQ